MAGLMRKGGGISPDVVEWTKDWKRLQSQKWRIRGGTEARMLLALGLYFGEHGIVQTRDAVQQRSLGKDEDNNRLNLTFNMIRKAAKRRMGRIWSVSPEFGASPSKIDPRAFDNADVVNDLIRAQDYRLQEKILHWQRVWWLVLTGVCIEHTPWIEDSVEEPLPAYDPETGELLWKEAQTGKTLPQSFVERLINEANFAPERFTLVEHLQTVGDVGAQIYSGFNFFIDNSVTQIKLLGPDQACYIVECKTVGWIRDVFGNEVASRVMSRPGDDLAIVKTKMLDKGPTLASMNLRDMLPAIQGSRSQDDPPLALVATRYQPANEEFPHGRRSIFVPEQLTLDDGECAYGEIPCTDFHYEAPTAHFFTGDFVTDIAPAQKFLNKRWSQMGEAANATIHEVLLLGGEMTKAQIPADIPGVIEDGIDENGNARVVALQRSPLPGWFLESTKEVANFIDVVGGSDLLQHKQFPGQIRGPLALPMIQELLDSEDGPFFSHMGEQLARVKQQRINRVKQFYPPIRTLHYTGKNRKDEVMVFHNDDVLKAGTDYTIIVDQQSLMPEMAVMRRARVIEDISGPAAILYTDPRTGKLDASKIAIAMKYTDSDVEDRAVQYRKLAQHFIARLWQAEVLPETVPRPFWDHSAVLDELEAAMATTEFEEASPQVQTGFQAFYERARNFLAAIQQSQMDSVQSQMMQGAVAQATQQAAAKAASYATDAAAGQIKAQAEMAVAAPPEQRRMMGGNRMLPQRQLGPAPAGAPA
jgi:hypothetical protein